MGAIRDTIRSAIPWADPLLDYFDWRKRLIASVCAIALFVWSYVRGLPWPVIVVLAFTTLVAVAYGLVLPSLVKLVNVGFQPSPNLDIWKHKKLFKLCEAACLLAGTVPVYQEMSMSADASAWFAQLCDAVKFNEISTIPPRKGPGAYLGTHTEIDKEELKKFCEKRERSPEFLKG